MRKLFSQELKNLMHENDDIYLLLGGVGYGFYETNDRILNCEASEQAMVDIAVGLAMKGKIPFVYAITPHLYRAFEGIRIYLDYYQIPVKLVGIGRNKDYTTLGFTHWGHDDYEVFGVFKNIEKRWPVKEEIPSLLREVVSTKKPYYINLAR